MTQVPLEDMTQLKVKNIFEGEIKIRSTKSPAWVLE